MSSYGQQNYRQNQILTASPEQILIMLYDGAIRFTRQAILGTEENRPSLKFEGISRAMAIVAEFANTLDHKVGGEIAENLDGLYHFMIRELTAARNGDVAKLRVVEGLLMDLRTTWIEAIEVVRNQAAEASASEVTAPGKSVAAPAGRTETSCAPREYRPLNVAM
jgi:flagellar protein FliS